MSHAGRFGFILVAIVAVVFGGESYAQDNPYRAVEGWAQLPEGKVWGQVPDVYPDGEGNLYVFQRCYSNTCVGLDDVPPIFKFDSSGKLVGSFGAGMLVWPHAIYVDPDGNVWVTDARGVEGRGHVVHKFTPDGKLLMTIGTPGVAGVGQYVFNGPADVAVAPNGDIFVADGHNNDRIVKYSPKGEYIKEWGEEGPGTDQLSQPHTLSFDSQGRLFCGDRYNNRVIIFDQEGNYIAHWSQFGRPSGLYIAPDDTIFVADSESNTRRNPGWKRGIRIGSAKDGWVKEFIPDDTEPNPDESATSGAEGIVGDTSGNIYGAEVGSRNFRKYTKQ